MIDLFRFSRPEEEGYLEWVELLPDCCNCKGSGEIDVEDDFSRTCDECEGFGKIYPE